LNNDEKKRNAFSLYSRGKSKREIAATLGTNSKTVSKWIQEQRQIVNHDLDKLNKEDYVGLSIQRFNELRSEIWTGLDRVSKPGDHLKYLKAAMDLEMKQTQFLTEMGFLKAEAKSQDLNVNIVGHLKAEVSASALDGLAAAMLSKRMGITPEQFIGMQGSQRNVYALSEPVGLEDRSEELEITPSPKPMKIDVVKSPLNGTRSILDADTTEGED